MARGSFLITTPLQGASRRASLSKAHLSPGIIRKFPLCYTGGVGEASLGQILPVSCLVAAANLMPCSSSRRRESVVGVAGKILRHCQGFSFLCEHLFQ